MNSKFERLLAGLRALDTVALAFSGGVDSSFLLAAAIRAGVNRTVAFIVASPFVPEREIRAAKHIAGTLGAELICLETDLMTNTDVVSNTRDRCYHCKKQIFAEIKNAAEGMGIVTLLHGVNQDDLSDFRPGLKAARELGFMAPLADAGLTKAEIRELSRQMGLETWDKPSQSCLATRIPYGEPVTEIDLLRIDKAEAFLQELGFNQVRVRCLEDTARIEVLPELVAKLADRELFQKVKSRLMQFGFEKIAIDMQGYKTGKMNHEIQ